MTNEETILLEAIPKRYSGIVKYISKIAPIPEFIYKWSERYPGN